MKIQTPILHKKAKYNRDAYITIVNDQIYFDCSDGEYGPVIISLDQFEDAISTHKKKIKNENKTVTQPRCD